MGKSFYIFTCDRLKRPRGGQPRWKKEAVFLQMFALEALEISPTSLTIDEEEEEEEEKEEGGSGAAIVKRLETSRLNCLKVKSRQRLLGGGRGGRAIRERVNVELLGEHLPRREGRRGRN